MQFEELLDEYYRVSNLSIASQITYSDVLRTFQNDMKITSLNDVTIAHVYHWKEKLLDRAKPATWNNYRRHMRALVNYAKKRGYIDDNPFIDVKPATETYANPKHCRTEDILRVIEALNNDIYPHGWFWQIVIRTFYYTGMRRNQLCGLIWQDLDHQNKQILLRAENSKTNRQWYVPMDDRLCPHLSTLYQKTMSVKQNISLTDQVFNLPIFSGTYKSTRLKGEHITTVFKRIGQRMGIRFSPHMIRHNFGTQTGQNISHQGSMDLLTLKNQLGHTNLSTTTRYIFPSIDPQRNIVKNLQDI